MKKWLSILLLLVITLCLFTACGGNETNDDGGTAALTPKAPEGFAWYQNAEMRVAYPSDWSKKEQDGTIIFSNADNTRTITVESQEKTTLYAGLDTQKYVQQFRNKLEAEGKHLSTARVAQTEKDGLTITDILQTFTVTATQEAIYQNRYVFNTNKKTYTVTLSQPNDQQTDKELGEKIRGTIAVK